MANRRFALFSEATIGDQLLVESGGLVIVPADGPTSQERIARSDIAVGEGRSYVEFYFYGSDGDINARIGIVKPDFDLDSLLGSAAGSIGYDMVGGTIYNEGVESILGFLPVTPGSYVGMLLDLTSDENARLAWYVNRELRHEIMLGAVDEWHFAVGLGCTDPQGMRCLMNAGQQAFDMPAPPSAGWFAAAPLQPAVRFATEDYLSDPEDSPANARYEGLVGGQGLLIRRSLQFWPWGSSASKALTVGSVAIADEQGTFDDLVTGDWRDQPVTVRTVASVDTPLSAATLVGNYVLERVEVVNDGSKTLVLRDTLVDLEVPLQPEVFPPFLEAVALQTVPFAVGACRSVPCLLVGQFDPPDYYLCQAQVPALLSLRDKGDPLEVVTDYSVWYDHRRVFVNSAAQGKVTADLSTEAFTAPVAGDNLWDGAANPFTGVEGGAIDGWDRSSESGDLPYFAAAYEADPIVQADQGHPTNVAGVVFPDGEPGSVCFIELGVVPARAMFRWELILRAGLFDPAAGIGISLTSEASGLQCFVNGEGYFTGVFTNQSDSIVAARLMYVRGSAGEEAWVTYAALYQLDDAGTALQPATLERALIAVFGQRKYRDWAPADAVAIDTATGYAGIGYYTRAAGLTVRQALDAILPSYCASLHQSAGQVRIARLVDPADTDPADYAFELEGGVDFTRDLVVMPDNAPGLTRRCYVQPNWEPLLEADLVTDYVDVPATLRAQLKAPGRILLSAGTTVAPRYAHADNAAPRVFLFDQESDGRAELERVLGLYTVNRHFYSVRLDGVLQDSYPLGAIGGLTYSRYGLSEGKAVMVVSSDWNPVTGRLDLILWG